MYSIKMRARQSIRLPRHSICDNLCDTTAYT